MMSHYSKINKLSREDAAYIAGLFDGEGSQYSDTFKITQAEYGIKALYFVKDAVGAGGVSLHREAKENWQPVYRYRLQSRAGIVNLLKQLLPYLKIKKIKAEEYIKRVDQNEK